MIAALFASVSAIRISGDKLGNGNWNPRPCEMGASAKDVGKGGCLPTPKYPLPVYPSLETSNEKLQEAANKKDSPDGSSAPAPSKAVPQTSKPAKAANLFISE